MPAATTQFRPCDLSKAKVRPDGDISSVFESFTQTAKVLDDSYAQLKKSIIKDPVAVKESWLRLKKDLAAGIAEIKKLGSQAIPQIDFQELESISLEKRKNITNRGCVVIKNVVPRSVAEDWKQEVINYIDENPQTGGFPADNKVVYELYWSKPQIKARSHPQLRQASAFMNSLWHASPNTRISLKQNVMYADRLRIRQPGDVMFSLGPHADGGSLERWVDKEYSLCYTPIFEGRYEEFDPYDCTHRVNTNMEYYESSGSCNIFRSFQGWLALSEIAPKEGTILFAPLIKIVTAYWMLRPFFDEEDNLNLDSSFPGAFPGKGQEFSDKTHLELCLADLMVPVPKVEPGDMVYWHCDMIHSVDPVHQGKLDSSVFYIPSAPLCDINVKYAHKQRESFLTGITPPDYPGFPFGPGESTHSGRASPQDVEEAGGDEAMQEFGLSPFKVVASTAGEAEMVERANKFLFY